MRLAGRHGHHERRIHPAAYAHGVGIRQVLAAVLPDLGGGRHDLARQRRIEQFRHVFDVAIALPAERNLGAGDGRFPVIRGQVGIHAAAHGAQGFIHVEHIDRAAELGR
ncbi:hypothetical protein SDC9_166824 [bioreactor metagenome]|uniref:Uncharacterized protein n=1 Tax=bioreactor metagenome TaxID=1076179 RepID=A0A645FYE9_9ZZZZ